MVKFIQRVPDRLTKKDPDFYRKIGSMGGKNTKANHTKSYFSALAKLSHVARKQSKEAPLPPEPGAAE